MKASSSEARMKYLSLALFAQRLIDALIDFVEAEKSQTLDKYIHEAIASLESLSSKGKTPQDTSRAFRYFEQYRTVDEITTPEEVQSILSILKALQGRKGSRKEIQGNAKKAIDFFYRLEKQALLNCNLPSKPLPDGIRELCKAP